MRVLVLGAGVTGEAVVRFFRGSAALRVLDDDPARRARVAELGVEVVDACALERALEDVDLVVPSPGVPPSHPVLRRAARQAVSVRSEIDLAAEALAAPLIAVTGTNGKTTVTTWIAAMLEASGVRAVAAGNLGPPLLDAARQPADVVVAEVSSFQLHYTTAAFHPRVAVLLNAAADHLDWHGGITSYHDDKARLFRFQRADELLVVNAGDPGAAILEGRARGRVARFDVHAHGGFDVSGDAAPDLPSPVVLALRELRSRIAVENGLAAALAAAELGATAAGTARALGAGPRLHHRVELVGQAGGVRFYDDSKATNPHATRAAVVGFEHAVLIAGGRNKGLDLGELRSLAPHLRAVVAIGESAHEVEAAFAGAVSVVVRAHSMREAVRAAAAEARRGDAVVLSPACASFDWYDSYAARGDDFSNEVAEVLGEHRA